MRYEDFLTSKRLVNAPTGCSVDATDIHESLFPFQRDIVKWACRQGRAAIFATTGMGKTRMQVEWARLMHSKRALIVAPLSVARQTAREAERIGVDVKYVRSGVGLGPGIFVTNYEMIESFDAADFDAVVLDESSILKALDGKTRRLLTEMFAATPARLCCTATPAPNDIAEIANHAEFLGVMKRSEMLAAFFIHDSGKTQDWRLKGHAEEPFWRWMASWSVSLRKPSDLGYDDAGYDLPPLVTTEHIVDSEFRPEGQLFFMDLGGLRGRLDARRDSLDARVAKVAELVNGSQDQWIVWCHLNDESDALTAAIPGAIELRGDQLPDAKVEAIERFQDGGARVLITKPKIAGFGLNLQNARNMAWCGLTDSFEEYFQAVRRCWRYGQSGQVNVHVVVSEPERVVLDNVKRKERAAAELLDNLMHHVRGHEMEQLTGQSRQFTYGTNDVRSDDGRYHAMLGDCAERIKEIPSNSVGLSVFSPPFMSLYTYSPTERDMGNSRTPDEFFAHFDFMTTELMRVVMPGRNIAVHCAQVSATMNSDGFMGLKDFRGDLIRHFVGKGWVYYGEVCIDKDPQAQAIRTKSHRLMFVTKNKDSSKSAPALADYILVFKKPGQNDEAIGTDVTNEEWIQWARPIWYGIKESDVLNTAEGREAEDEKHICLAAGSLVLTRAGHIAIEQVRVGDEVLTHMGRWRAVLATKCNGVRPIIRTCAQGVADLRTTPDHKLWTRVGTGADAKRQALAAEPQWVEAAETLGSYINMKLPPVEDCGLTEHECWIIGRWLGDGHRGTRRTSGARGAGFGQFHISCAHQESEGLVSMLGEHAGPVTTNATASQIALRGLRREARQVLARCGEGAAGKRVPSELISLPTEKAEALLSGYLSADGHYVAKYDRRCASSVSRALLLGMAMVAQRARGVVASVYAGRPARDCTIEGRAVHAKQDWVMIFRDSPGYKQSGWIGDDGAWKKVRKSESAGTAEVWDIRVDEDESFTAEGAIVKNCPLQLGTIERCVRLWSNPGDLVLSPFMGIGSEGYESLRLGRRFVGVELKPAYFRTAVRNLERAAFSDKRQMGLFE